MTSNLHYIMRFCADDANPDHRKVIRDGLTLDEAQAHCDDERTSGDGWFDGYQVGEPVSPVQQPTHTAPLPAELGGVNVGRTATKPSEMGHDYTLTDAQLEAMSTREESAEVAAVLPEPRAKTTKIRIEYVDGVVGEFISQPDGSWHQRIDGLRVTGYDGPNVMRVLANAVGTKEIAE